MEMIKQGYIWRIGDGTNVKIWTNPWIPRAWSRQVITPKGSHLISHVSELMCPITGGWHEAMVRDTFWPEDARHILQIPLREGVEDFIAWHYDGKGIHSVRSAYKLQSQLAKHARNGSLAVVQRWLASLIDMEMMLGNAFGNSHAQRNFRCSYGE